MSLRIAAVQMVSGPDITRPTGRSTHGNSMIVDPWGEVIARQDKGEGIVVVAIGVDAPVAAVAQELIEQIGVVSENGK